MRATDPVVAPSCPGNWGTTSAGNEPAVRYVNRANVPGYPVHLRPVDSLTGGTLGSDRSRVADGSAVGTLAIFRPSDEVVAKKAIFALTAVAAGITLLSTVVFPSAQTRAASGLTTIVCLAIVVLAAWLVVASSPSAWLWAAYPIMAVATIAVLDVASADASVTAQVFFLFPVLYAGALLQRAAATVVCAVAIAADACVNVALLPIPVTIVVTSFMGAALGTVAALLCHLGTQNQRLIAELNRRAAIDPLTGLLTRRVLDTAANSALTGARTHTGTALLLIDLDRFKAINDDYGHPAGDVVLQELAGLLTRVNRSSDIISRIGGDEIAVLLPGCSAESAKQRAEEIVHAVRAHKVDISDCSLADNRESNKHLALTVSVGVAHSPTHARDLRELYAAADVSLYEAKRAGRDRVGEMAPPTNAATASSDGARR